MKVRYKQKGTAGHRAHHEVIDESTLFYVARSPLDDAPEALLKSEYEPVPETWHDVTGECEYSDLSATGKYLSHGDVSLMEAMGLSMHQLGYRLRKVKVAELMTDHCSGDAFIVERKAP
jgi:hypothetical protein